MVVNLDDFMYIIPPEFRIATPNAALHKRPQIIPYFINSSVAFKCAVFIIYLPSQKSIHALSVYAFQKNAHTRSK